MVAASQCPSLDRSRFSIIRICAPLREIATLNFKMFVSTNVSSNCHVAGAAGGDGGDGDGEWRWRFRGLPRDRRADGSARPADEEGTCPRSALGVAATGAAAGDWATRASHPSARLGGP